MRADLWRFDTGSLPQGLALCRYSITMKKIKILLSLTTNDNDYQIEQAASAEETARKLGVDLQIVYADNDAINQSQQLLKIIQSGSRGTTGCHCVRTGGSTGLPQVAKAAVSAGIGWVILNREVDYVAQLRAGHKVPVFCITSDHKEIGRIQGHQIAALVPRGGSILYIQGPSGSDAAQQRTDGMQQRKPENVQVRMVRAQWTEGSSYQAGKRTALGKLSHSRNPQMDAIIAQDDSMAMGARKAFQEIADMEQRDRWLALPFTGCDGMPKTGQAWVRNGMLAATVIVPANAGTAVDMLAHALQTGVKPPGRTFMDVRSFPSIEDLSRRSR